ncbi:PPE domain-containing protein [Mycobacterium sp. SMC-14]|uniref:PPE domain-containing protein n=1 Tax=Mycobacterium sp. SMC-14 TaxID=3385968 RepID=UPI00390CBD57
MASPPEVHSALLSAGAGPGPLLAAASAWSALGVQYTDAAEDLLALLGSVQAGAWQGPSAQAYVAAHSPYLAWLTQAGADSVAAATQYETAAGAYVSALGAMPTLPELAANHATHGVLVATNFFGINTIPIALNEADYVRMWVQAAATMATYQAVSGAAVASVPHTPAAPPILKVDAQPADDDEGTDPTVNDPLDQLIAKILQTASNGQINWDPAHAMMNGIPYDEYVDPNQPMFWLVRALELFEDFQQLGVNFQQNPALAFQYLVQLAEFDWPTHLAEIGSWLAQSPQLFAAAVGMLVAPVGAVGGFAGLAGLAGLPQPIAPLPPGAAPDAFAGVGSASAGASAPAMPTAPAPAPTPAPAPATAGVSGPAPAPPPAPPGATPFFPPYLLGPPGTGTGSGMPVGAGASRKASEPRGSEAAAAATAAERDQQRARRRRRAKLRRPDDAVMDLNVEVIPDWADPADPSVTASSRGLTGFAGTLARDHTRAGGLAVSSGGTFDDTPRMPLLPGGWRDEKG